MPTSQAVVVTGLGVISPIGIGRDAFWNALDAGQGGVGTITLFDASSLPTRIGAEVKNFDPREFVKPRKSLKVMARDAQFCVASADIACSDAGLAGQVDPDRFGVVFGAGVMRADTEEMQACFDACIVDGTFDFRRWGEHSMPKCYPLGMLRLLPNMLASHISITQDARGPNNTICQGDISGLLALGEAMRVIQRGHADVMLSGGARSPLHPYDMIRRALYADLSRRNDEPEHASRPFDRDRDGQVIGEGAATLVLESAAHAARRKTPVLARLLGWASTCETPRAAPGDGLRRAIRLALADAGLTPAELGHVNAHGLGTIDDDRLEARVLGELLPEVPVLAPKSYFGNLEEASGAIEAAVSVLAIHQGRVPATLNFGSGEPGFGPRVIVEGPLTGAAPRALLLNRTRQGQCVAMVVGPGDEAPS